MTARLDANARCPSLKLLTRPATGVKALLPEYASDVEAPLSVTMLCSDDSTYAEATHFTQFLAEKLGGGIVFQVNHWTFAELQQLWPGVVAAELAEETHVLVLVTAQPHALPMPVRKWIASWLNEARPWNALVCLFGIRDGCCLDPSESHCLRNACREAGIAFLVSSFRARPDAANPDIRLAAAAAEIEHSLEISHWGINE